MTEFDQRVEEILIKQLKEKFPTHKLINIKLRKKILLKRIFRFIGEESTAAGLKSTLTDDPTWIIDPIDGTTNFVHG